MTAAHRAKLDSDKFGDEAGDQTGGLIESCTRLSFSKLVDFINGMTLMLNGEVTRDFT